MFITSGDANLYAVSFGGAERTILGFGGWIGSWELWADPFEHLSRGWRTLAFDHRGCGATIAPVESITFDALVDDVFAVMDAYGVERCVLAGESAGAAVALGAALKRPERVVGLVIVDGVYYREANRANNAFRAGLQSAFVPTTERFVQLCLPAPEDGRLRRWGMQLLLRTTPEAALALYDVALATDLRPALARISQPTLVLHCEGDQLAPVADGRALASTLPNARLQLIPGNVHVPTVTHARIVADAIEAMFGQSPL